MQLRYVHINNSDNNNTTTKETTAKEKKKKKKKEEEEEKKEEEEGRGRENEHMMYSVHDWIQHMHTVQPLIVPCTLCMSFGLSALSFSLFFSPLPTPFGSCD